jgi:hypothetical protein
MPTKIKLVVVAALATLVAGPAFAMDQDTASVTINSGRYLPELNLLPAPAGAFASARPGRVHVGRLPVTAPERHFRLQGRGLGE